VTFYMEREIGEQPEMLRSRAAAWQRECIEAHKALASRKDRALLGRGSSGHARVFCSYLHGLRTGRQALDFRPWLTTQPSAEKAGWSDTAALAFSVSGESADVVHSARWLRDHDAYVLGVTNQAGPQSALGAVAHRMVRFDAGVEQAVPATKTFTAQLFVAAALCGYRIEEAALETAHAIDSLLHSGLPSLLADFVDGARAVLWVARGPAYAGALDAALKLQEAAGVLSLGYSAAEILHSPIGFLEESDRVLLFLDSDNPLESAEAVIVALVARGTPFLILASAEGGRRRPDAQVLSLPSERWARTAVLAVAGQSVALELARRRGLNPDSPPGWHRVPPAI
jgi:glucosamine--fructose-6-phosphate aminotransferase (isomerizing)